MGGKLDIMCFDKTGTLTEDGLDILGVRVATDGRFNEIIEETSSLYRAVYERTQRNFAAVLYTMATCHSLRSVDNELVGDPLELKMVEFSGWSFDERDQSAMDRDGDDQGGLSPSVARPPTEFVEYLRGNEPTNASTVCFSPHVSQLCQIGCQFYCGPSTNTLLKGIPLSSASCEVSNSSLSCGGQVW